MQSHLRSRRNGRLGPGVASSGVTKSMTGLAVAMAAGVLRPWLPGASARVRRRLRRRRGVSSSGRLLGVGAPGCPMIALRRP